MNYLHKPVIIGLIGMLLSACGNEDSPLYRHSPVVAKLEVPPNLLEPEQDDTYEIPAIGRSLSQTFKVDDTMISLVVEGQDRWLKIKGEPGQVWMRVKEFFTQAEVDLAWEDRKLGILETKWVDNYESRFARDKFRLRIEPDSKGVSRLYVAHRGVQDLLVDGSFREFTTTRPSDPELEAELLGRLLIFMGMERKKAEEIELAAARIKEEVKLLNKDTLAIEVNSNRDHSWHALLRSIDRSGGIIGERDVNKAELDIRIALAGSGFFAGLGLGSEEPQNFKLKLLDKGDKQHIVVVDEKEAVRRDESASQLLKALLENW